MLDKPVLDKFVEGKPVTFGDAKTERPWKETIRSVIGPWKKELISRSTVILDFSLDVSRFTIKGKQTRNDLDNLAKPVLHALVEVNILYSDSDILDLVLRKRTGNREGVRIRVYEWRETNVKL